MAIIQYEVIVWLVPYQTGDFPLGAVVTFNAQFRDPILKTPLNPETVLFKGGVPGSLALVAGTIVNPAVGLYQSVFALSSCGKFMMQAIAQDGSGNDEGIGTMIVTVYDTGA